jgi:hypothetical protein
MKKIIGSIFVLILNIGLTFGQDYKIAKNTGRLEIKELNHVTVEGYMGNEIIFSSDDEDRDEDEDKRSKGLRAVSSLGLEDNTGLGISVQDKGGVIEVYQLKKMDGPDITIKVPKGVVVSYSHSSPYGDDVSFKNIEGELEVSTVHNSVELSNITGPISVKTVHGDIDATFSATLKSPILIASVHGHVDVAMPSSTKATLRLGTSWGEIFVDPEFKIEFDQKPGMVKHSDNLSNLSSTHDNVYLRKK